MDNRDCETCRHEDVPSDQAPCKDCNVLIGNKWEPVDEDEYVKEVFRKRYDKQH